MILRTELWEYMRRMVKDMGSSVREAWNAATAMHVCFYESWCAREGVKAVGGSIEKLVEETASRIKGR